jgi:hypothetical protein
MWDANKLIYKESVKIKSFLYPEKTILNPNPILPTQKEIKDFMSNIDIKDKKTFALLMDIIKK